MIPENIYSRIVYTAFDGCLHWFHLLPGCNSGPIPFYSSLPDLICPFESILR